LVVPLAGTWIEIIVPGRSKFFRKVVPLAGTWIEMRHQGNIDWDSVVVPLAGTWIEIEKAPIKLLEITGRSPCGDVD